MLPYNKNLTQNARNLRKNMTPQEKHLWYDFFKRLPITVKRQHNIENYIVDFYIPKVKIVVEIDGIQHKSLENQQMDLSRDECLGKWGIKVLRYSNLSLDEAFSTVTADILSKIGLTFSDLKPIK